MRSFDKRGLDESLTSSENSESQADSVIKFSKNSQDKPAFRDMILLQLNALCPFIFIFGYRATGINPIVTFYSCIYCAEFVLPQTYLLYSSKAFPLQAAPSLPPINTYFQPSCVAFYDWWRPLKTQMQMLRQNTSMLLCTAISALILPFLCLELICFFAGIPVAVPFTVSSFHKVLGTLVYIAVVPIFSTLTWKLILPGGMSRVLKAQTSSSYLGLVRVYLLAVQISYKCVVFTLYLDTSLGFLLMSFVIVKVVLLELARNMGFLTVIIARMAVNTSFAAFVIYHLDKGS